jgi:hypothetical protein
VNARARVSLATALPVVGSLTLFFAVSLVIVGLLALVSVGGLAFPHRVYPTQALLQSALPNDAINLVLGVPMLLASMWLTRRARLIGLLFWPGALMYMVYNSLARVFDLPVGWAFLANLALVTLSAYASIGLIASIDGAAVQQRLAGAVPARLSGGVLAGLGSLMLLRAVGVIGHALIVGTTVPATELSVLISDFLLSPAVVIGGILLWQRRALGYVSGAGLLFQSSMLFIGLIVFLLLQPLLSQAPFAPIDVIVVSAMGMICFVPFGLFVRGVLASTA